MSAQASEFDNAIPGAEIDRRVRRKCESVEPGGSRTDSTTDFAQSRGVKTAPGKDTWFRVRGRNSVMVT